MSSIKVYFVYAYQIGKWILSKLWPVLALSIIGLAHYGLYKTVPCNIQNTNKLFSSCLQFIGGIVILYSVNDNMGTFRNQNLLTLAKNLVTSFPKLKQSGTFQIQGVQVQCSIGEVTLTATKVFDSVEEHLKELERQIVEFKRNVDAREQKVLERLDVLRTELNSQISENVSEIRVVKKQLDDSFIGGIKVQIFGVLLVLYGAVVSYYS